MSRGEDEEAPRGGNHARPEKKCVAAGDSSADVGFAWCRPSNESTTVEILAMASDAAWFTANPGRRLRLRLAFPGELGLPEECDTAVIAVRGTDYGDHGELDREPIFASWPVEEAPLESIPDDATAEAVFLLAARFVAANTNDPQRVLRNGFPEHAARLLWQWSKHCRLWNARAEGHA